MACNFDYRFTNKAEQDLDDILRYISNDLNNSTAAQAFYFDTFQQIETLRAFPNTGKLLDNEFAADKTVRRILIDNYTLYYKPEKIEKLIVILRIVYSKRNLDELVKIF